ncbi:HNH endonuclease, partial [Escherichia coli]
HIDGDPLNNAISNLREVTKEQNQANMIPRKKTKSGYKGVHPRVDNKGFWATIRCNGKSHYLGQFNTAEEAAKPMMLHHWNCMVNMDTGILADS